MKRRLLNIATGVSATLCALFAVACVRSNFMADNVEGTVGLKSPPMPYVSFISSGGTLTVAVVPQCPLHYAWNWSAAGGIPERRWLRAGFRSYRVDRVRGPDDAYARRAGSRRGSCRESEAPAREGEAPAEPCPSSARSNPDSYDPP